MPWIIKVLDQSIIFTVISDYCKKRQQNRPFSHIVMDLHQEALAAIETSLETPWGPPAMPELHPRTRNISDSNADSIGTIPRRWVGLTRPHEFHKPKLTKEASTSMEDLSCPPTDFSMPGNIVRPKSMCVPDIKYYHQDRENTIEPLINKFRCFKPIQDDRLNNVAEEDDINTNPVIERNRQVKLRRNPVQRAASRLYRAKQDSVDSLQCSLTRDCVGPEFVVRASLPSKQLTMPDIKGSTRKVITVIMLNGQKLDVVCNPNSTTAGQLFEMIIQKEHIEENFMLGLSALIAGDFVFLPSDTRICKAMPSENVAQSSSVLTLFMRVRFFLPSLRGIRSSQARHLLYLQLRRSILEHQLPCSFKQLIELDGLALQAEFGDFNEREHGTRDYFLIEHYVPETMTCAIDDHNRLKQELIHAHKYKKGMEIEKAEEDFIILAQTLPQYGGHFYTASWILKDHTQKDIWLYISAQGINLYERAKSNGNNYGPQLYETFEWRSIQTLCYSKHYLCILPHISKLHSPKFKKYKLKMDHKKSYFTFRLASLHHQFFLRLRTEYTSLQTLSQQFGIPLKDIKNETNSLYKLEALANPVYETIDCGTVNAETEFKIEFRSSSKCAGNLENRHLKSKSIHDFTNIGENELTLVNNNNNSGLILDSSYFCGLPTVGGDKRRGVKMGTRAISNLNTRVSRSMEAVNDNNNYLDDESLQSVSLHCSSTSISLCPTAEQAPTNEAYIIDASIKSYTNQLLPDFQETLSESLLDKLNNISFPEERQLINITIERDKKGSLGMQITEGSDGNVYVQSVIPGGPAHLSGNIIRGDQVIAVNQKELIGIRYNEALNILKNTGQWVTFILSRGVPRRVRSPRNIDYDDLKAKVDLSNINESHLKSLKMDNTMNKLKHLSSQSTIKPFSYVENFHENEEGPIEKHLTENCHDKLNLRKHQKVEASSEVPYHKHIRYEIENDYGAFNENVPLNKNISKSCTQIYSPDHRRAKIIDMIPKTQMVLSNFHSLDRNLLRELKSENLEKHAIPPIALPRSLGLSRKWRGPVRYPVTPIKKHIDSDYTTTSDDEQVFI